MIRKGALVTLYQVWETFPVSSRANGSVGEGNPDVDTLRKGEIALVLQAGKASAKILTPRGKVGWIWMPRLVEV